MPKLSTVLSGDSEELATFERAATILARYEDAKARRDAYLTLWQDCYAYTLPDQARFTSSVSSLNRLQNQLFDGTAADAVDQLAASLLGHLTPPWVNWFGLGAGVEVGEDLAVPLQPVLETATRVMQGQIDRSNLAVELHQCFLDLVVGGTACLQIEETEPGSPVAFTCRAVPLHEIILGESARGRLDTVYRHRRVTLDQAQKLPVRFCDQIKQELEKSQDNTIEILEFIESSHHEYEVGWIALNNRHEVIACDSRPVLTSPYIAFRWMKAPGDVYGRSPVMKALPDIKTANKVVELILKNASIAVTGIWQAEDDGVLNPANIELVPGAIIPKAVGSAGLKPLEMPARFDVSQLVLDDLRARIRHALLVDRFAPVDRPGMTATEVLERSSEVALLLGATYGRLQTELLTPLLTRIYDILRHRGDVPDLALDGRNMQLLYRSPLARAQAQQSIRNVLSWLDGVSHLGDEARQTLNGPAIVRHLADMLGISETLLVSAAVPPLSQPQE